VYRAYVEGVDVISFENGQVFCNRDATNTVSAAGSYRLGSGLIMQRNADFIFNDAGTAYIPYSGSIHFCLNGQPGSAPVRANTVPALLVVIDNEDRYGEADNWGANAEGDLTILKYDEVELHFARDVLWLIHSEVSPSSSNSSAFACGRLGLHPPEFTFPVELSDLKAAAIDADLQPKEGSDPLGNPQLHMGYAVIGSEDAVVYADGDVPTDDEVIIVSVRDYSLLDVS